MATFEYKAVTPAGVTVTEAIEANSQEIASRDLIKKGYRVISIKEKGGKSGGLLNMEIGGDLFKAKIKTEEIVLFTRELVTLLQAGVPLLTAIEALSSQSTKSFGEVLNKIYVDVMSGKSLSQALDAHPKVFSKLYVNSVRAGEVSGSLDDVLERMGNLMKKDEEMQKEVKGAMRYPIIVICAMVIAMVVVMVKVIPGFIKMFQQMNMDLPLPTRILIAMSKFTQANIGALAIGAVILFGLFKWYTSTPKGRYWWDGILMKIPITGTLLVKTAMARFTKMFETLNRSGLPIIQTLMTVSSAVGNVVIEDMIKQVAVNIEKGQGIAGSMKKFDLFPPMVIRMISIGEQSGSLDNMLGSIAEHYEIEVQYAVKGLVGMIEPLLTLSMGVGVLIMAMGIFLPMWDMIGMIK